MNFDDCDSMSSPICGQYSKLYIDSQTLKPYYQKTDKPKVFIHASNNAWFVSDGKNVTLAIALESSECPYGLTSWIVYADNQVHTYLNLVHLFHNVSFWRSHSF